MGWRIRLVDNPSARLLRLLVLLQARSRWSGRELAGRLEVSVRTLRYDIDKLRQLGYPVLGGTGAAGGYELQPGPVLPPLLLDDPGLNQALLGQPLEFAVQLLRCGHPEVRHRRVKILGQVIAGRLALEQRDQHGVT